MRFELCGGREAPEWLLGEAAGVAQLAPQDLAQVARECVQHLLAPPDGAAAAQGPGVNSDRKAQLAVVEFVVRNACRFQLAPNVVGRELSQIGFPSDACEALVQVIAGNQKQVRLALEKQTLRMNGLDETKEIGWTNLVTLQSKQSCSISRTVEFSIPTRQHGSHTTCRDLSFEVDVESLQLLRAELAKAKKIASAASTTFSHTL